jgi:YYY domain-containing protein
MNYYYWGQVVVASLIKLTGILPWVAYNLAIPTIAALTGTTLASVVYNVLISRADAPMHRKQWAFGGAIAAVLLGIVGGNLHAIPQFLAWITRLDTSPLRTDAIGVVGLTSFVRGLWLWVTSMGHGLPPFVFDFWGPTRVITTESTTPITEFPYFTFLYGDLHAHMIAMPFGMLAVLLAINLVRQPAWVPRLAGRSGREVVAAIVEAARTPAALTLALAALNVGLTRMINSWDFPTYLGLTGAAVLLAEVLRPNRDWKTAIGRTLVLGAMVAVASQVLILPYLRTNELFYSGVQLSRDRTGLVQFVVIMGAFLVVLATYLGFRIAALRERLLRGALLGLGAAVAPAPQQFVATDASPTQQRRFALASAPSADRWAGTMAVVALLVVLVTLMGGSAVVGVSLFGIAALAVIALLRPPAPGMAFLFLLTATALAIIGGVEVFTLKGDLGRMNTVFKFYLQAWLFLSITSGVMLALLSRRVTGSRWLMKGRRRGLAIGLIAILIVPFIYTLMATPVKVAFRFTPTAPTLDGMAYMNQSKYSDEKGDMVLPDDFMAINWMLDNIQGSPVIVEGLAPIYHWRSRVSVYTGLPTVIGWDWHQTQQRGDFSFMIERRVRDTEAFFNNPSPDIARQYIERYNVDYIYVGGLERAYHSAQGLAKFDGMVGTDLREVYKRGVVTIYQVVR